MANLTNLAPNTNPSTPFKSTFHVPHRDPDDLERSAGSTSISHLFDGLSHVYSFEFLPGGLNALYFHDSHFSARLERSISDRSNAWNSGVSFGAKVVQENERTAWESLGSYLSPKNLAKLNPMQGLKTPTSIKSINSMAMSGLKGLASLPRTLARPAAAKAPRSSQDGILMDSTIDPAVSPYNTGAFLHILPFADANNASFPRFLATSPSTFMSLIDPVNLSSESVAIPNLLKLLPPATSHLIASPAPPYDVPTKTLYFPLLALSATTATLTILTSTPESYPEFLPLNTLPNVRASYAPLVAVTENFLVVVLTNYYIPQLSGVMWLNLYKNVHESATFKPDEPLEFLILEKSTGALICKHTAPGGVIPPWGIVSATESATSTGEPTISLDLTVHPDPRFYEFTFLNHLKSANQIESSASLRRFILLISSPLTPAFEGGTSLHSFPITAHYTILSSLPLDFVIPSKTTPEILFGLSTFSTTAPWFDTIVKLDTITLDTIEWGQQGVLVGPVVFIANPIVAATGTRVEDGGINAVLVSTLRGARNGLLVLDADTLREIAFIECREFLPLVLAAAWAAGDVPEAGLESINAVNGNADIVVDVVDVVDVDVEGNADVDVDVDGGSGSGGGGGKVSAMAGELSEVTIIINAPNLDMNQENENEIHHNDDVSVSADYPAVSAEDIDGFETGTEQVFSESEDAEFDLAPMDSIAFHHQDQAVVAEVLEEKKEVRNGSGSPNRSSSKKKRAGKK